jgi:hypothetical protein
MDITQKQIEDLDAEDKAMFERYVRNKMKRAAMEYIKEEQGVEEHEPERRI